MLPVRKKNRKRYDNDSKTFLLVHEAMNVLKKLKVALSHSFTGFMLAVKVLFQYCNFIEKFCTVSSLSFNNFYI